LFFSGPAPALKTTEKTPEKTPEKTTDIASNSKLVASVSTPPPNDIPPARRQAIEPDAAPVAKRSGRSGWVLGLLGLVGIAALGLWQWENVSAQARGIKSAIAASTVSNSRDQVQMNSDGEAFQRNRATNSDRANPPSSNPATEELPTEELPTEELLHHRRYEEAAADDLVPLDSNREIKLQRAAQESVTKMIAQAKSEGVNLGIASGFRSIQDQQYLFFDMKAERGETSKTRAEVSAPPGYSEHHTGYAVDFIDEDQSATHIEKSFEDTAAYRWLAKNAAFYNFEMSFPDDPSSPLSYEPWHWRYVGDQKSLEMFYKE
jgi:zinc D-Ala-D-Ala carboxypeptidase